MNSLQMKKQNAVLGGSPRLQKTNAASPRSRAQLNVNTGKGDQFGFQANNVAGAKLNGLDKRDKKSFNRGGTRDNILDDDNDGFEDLTLKHSSRKDYNRGGGSTTAAFMAEVDEDERYHGHHDKYDKRYDHHGRRRSSSSHRKSYKSKSRSPKRSSHHDKHRKSRKRHRHDRSSSSDGRRLTDSDYSRSSRSTSSDDYDYRKSLQIEDLMKQIQQTAEDYTQKYSKPGQDADIWKYMKWQQHDGRAAAEYTEFVKYLTGTLFNPKDTSNYNHFKRITEKEANTIFHRFEMDCKHQHEKNYQTGMTKKFLNLAKFQKELKKYAVQGRGTVVAKKFKDMQRALKVSFKIRQAIMEELHYNTGGLIAIFEKLDVYNKKFLDERTLYEGLQKLGVRNISKDDVALFIETIDDNGDKQISYMEFSKQMAECDDGKTLDDPSHHLFPLFEDIRRRTRQSSQSLAYQFGVRREPDEKGRMTKQVVPWKIFMESLAKLRPRDLAYYEKELYALLDVKANNQKVDFQQFVDLVGLDRDASQAHRGCMHQKVAVGNDPEGTRKRREDARFVMRLLISRGIRPQGMRYDFEAAATPGRTPPGTIQSAAFVGVLSQHCEDRQKLDPKRLEVIAAIFLNHDNLVDYERFLAYLDSTIAMQSNLAYIFGELNAIGQPKPSAAQELLTALRKNTNTRSLTHQELEEAFKRLQILVSDDELGLLMLDYDTTGAARAFELDVFESDFVEWQTQEFRDNQFGGWRKAYEKYDDYITTSFPGSTHGQDQFGRTTSRAVPDAYKPMLKDIIDAIVRRHSGTLQWFRSHCYHTADTNVLSINEFLKAVDALGIVAQGHWRFTPQDLFAVLKTPGRDDLDIHVLDEILKEVQYSDVHKQTKEEKTLTELVRVVNGDAEYLSQEHQRMMDESRRRGPPTMEEFAHFLVGLFPPQMGPSRRELEAMLQQYGQDRWGRGGDGVLDIVEFTRAFCKLREQRGIPAGVYRPSRPGLRPDPIGGAVVNPLLPGQSATQTRAGVGQVGTHRSPPYNGYAMPAEATAPSARPPDAFTALMTAAYLADVLVGDHFEKYARASHGQNKSFDGGKTLDAQAFGHAVGDLGIGWNSRDSAQVCTWIHQAHNAFQGRGQSRGRYERDSGYNQQSPGEVTAEEVDQAVYHEVPVTIWEMQDRALAELRSAAQRDGVDVQAAFDQAKDRYTRANRRSSQNPRDREALLTFSEAKRVLEDSIRSRVPKDELDVLIKRYEDQSHYGKADRGSSRSASLANIMVDTKRLVDDLALGPAVRSKTNTTPRTAVAEAEKLAEVMDDIAGQVNKGAGLQALFTTLSGAERGQSGGVISANRFTAELTQAGVRLRPADEALLTAHYAAPVYGSSGRGDVDYRRFCEDLGRIINKKPGGRGHRPSVALTQGQKDLLARGKDFIDRAPKQQTEPQARLMAEFKRKDHSGRGYLTMAEVGDCMRAAGLQQMFDDRYGNDRSHYAQNRNYEEEWCRCTEPNSANKYPYKELMELLCGAKEGAELFSADIRALEAGSWRLGRATSGGWTAPAGTRDAQTAALASLGEKLIATGKNYEQALIRAAGNQAALPANKLTDCLVKNLGISFTKSERADLDSFCKERSTSTGVVKLAAFLTAVGLPAQLVGHNTNTRFGSGAGARPLKAEDLQAAQDLLNKIRAECTRTNRTPMAMFARCKNDESDIAVRPQAFADVINRDLGQPFAQHIDLDKHIGLLVAYLQDEIPNQISYRKLTLAMSQVQGEAPLQQKGAAEQAEYEAKLRRSVAEKQSPAIIDFSKWLSKYNKSVNDILKYKTSISRSSTKQSKDNDTMTQAEFKTALTKLNYPSKEHTKLTEALTDGNKKDGVVSLTRLRDHIKRAQSRQGLTQAAASDQLARFDPKIRGYITKISDFLKRESMSIKELHAKVDADGDGEVDKQEFVNAMRRFEIAGLNPADLGQLFDSLDINDRARLNLVEFSLFIKGAELSKQQKLKQMETQDPELYKQMQDEIRELFDSFDADGDGRVTAEEIYRTLQSFGVSKTIEQCREMISSVGAGADGLSRQQFGNLMLPVMQEEMLGNEDSMDKLRTVFLDCDVDNSGTLSVEELWNAIKKMGADVDLEDVIQLMSEIDVDRDGQLDVNEFVSLIGLGDQINFQNHRSSNTFQKIKKARCLNPKDFLKSFKDMPTNFAPSFLSERWIKFNKNQPSSVFSAQIDPNTMLWKDVLDPSEHELHSCEWKKTLAKKDQKSKPYLRSMESTVACMLTIQDAQGVPLPKPGKDVQAFQDEDIVKRAVRVCIEHAPNQRKEVVYNSVQAPATWTKSAEDIWSFDANDKSLRSIFFRTTKADGLDQGICRILFELVVYVKNRSDNKVTEMCCGWCEIPYSDLNKQMTHKLEIRGGSPKAEVQISNEDIRAERTGLNFVKKVISNGIQTRLSVEVRPLSKLDAAQKLHLELMPSTCLVHKSLLYFMSGFMNYKAQKLLREASKQGFYKPAGDNVIASLPRIYDCPDIVEELSAIWTEDVTPLIEKAKLNIDYIMTKSQEAISRIYPILYSVEFKGILNGNATSSAAGDPDLLQKRKDLLQSALRYEQVHTVKRQAPAPPSDLTVFKPFSLKELDYDVWDTTRSQQDRFREKLKQKGCFDHNHHHAPGAVHDHPDPAGGGYSDHLHPPPGPYQQNMDKYGSDPNHNKGYYGTNPNTGTGYGEGGYMYNDGYAYKNPNERAKDPAYLDRQSPMYDAQRGHGGTNQPYEPFRGYQQADDRGYGHSPSGYGNQAPYQGGGYGQSYGGGSGAPDPYNRTAQKSVRFADQQPGYGGYQR